MKYKINKYLNGSKQGVILLHEIYGINDFIKAKCEQFQSAGYDVFCPDINDGVIFSYEETWQASQKASREIQQFLEERSGHKNLRSQLVSHCASCCGLCCIALYFAKAEGFPQDKEPGTPCSKLAEDFRCKIHQDLSRRGLKGCRAYDCLGAGQRVTQQIYKGRTWRQLSKSEQQQMFGVFVRVYQVHQMLWYLIEAAEKDKCLREQAEQLIQEGLAMMHLAPKELSIKEIEPYRIKVNQVLKMVCKNSRPIDKDCIGKCFSGTDLSGRDFSMALLIAADLSKCNLENANFLGADLRDADITDADLSKSIFLTQMQINETKGSQNTRLPKWITKPVWWGSLPCK